MAFSTYLAQQLNLSAIDEGIEDKPDLEFLINVECQYGQSYYFLKPMPGDSEIGKFHVFD